MATLERVLAAGTFSQEEYRTAVEFFESATGIAAHDDGTFVGRLPTSGLRDDVAAWKSWYVKHGASLRRDPTSGQIRGANDGDIKNEPRRSP